MSNTTNIGVIGTGMIGSSIGLALKKRVPNRIKVLGYDKDSKMLEYSQNMNAIEKSCKSIHELCVESEIIIISTPLSAYRGVFEEIKEVDNEELKSKIITDVGSVKEKPLSDLIQEFPNHIRKIFVPAHPVAGKEIGGAKNADADLYENKKIIITPTKYNKNEELIATEELWISMGCNRADKISMTKHDEIYAKVSHLVQLLSYAIYDFFSECDELKPFLRLSNSPKDVWKPIFKYNYKNINKAKNLFLYTLIKNTAKVGKRDFPEISKNKLNSKKVETSENVELYAASIIASSLSEIISKEELNYIGTGYKSFTDIINQIILPPVSESCEDNLKSLLTKISSHVENWDISRNI